MHKNSEINNYRPASVRMFAESQVSHERLLHMKATAETALTMAKNYKKKVINQNEVYIAGLSHDCAKEYDLKTMQFFAMKDIEYPPSYEELNSPGLLHGKAGAMLLREHFAMIKAHVLQAVRWHTTGHIKMGVPGAFVFCADYLEPGRTELTFHLKQSILKMELEAMVMAVLELRMENTLKKKHPIAENSKILYDKLKQGYEI